MEIHSARDDIFLTPGAVTRHGRFVEAKAQPYKFADSSYWDRQPGEPDDDEWEDNYYDGDDGNDNNDDDNADQKKKKDDDDDDYDGLDSTSERLQNAGRGDGQHEARRRANDLNPQHQEGPGPDGRDYPIPGKTVDRYFESPEEEALFNAAFGDRPGGSSGLNDPSPFGPHGDGGGQGMSDDEFVDRFMQGGDRPGGSSGLNDPTTKPGHNSSHKQAQLPPWMDDDGNDIEDDDEQKRRNRDFDDSIDFPDGNVPPRPKRDTGPSHDASRRRAEVKYNPIGTGSDSAAFPGGGGAVASEDGKWAVYHDGEAPMGRQPDHGGFANGGLAEAKSAIRDAMSQCQNCKSKISAKHAEAENGTSGNDDYQNNNPFDESDYLNSKVPPLTDEQKKKDEAPEKDKYASKRRRLADSKEFSDSEFHAPHEGQKCSRWQHGDPAPAAVACRESGGNHYGCCSTHKTEMTKGASDETNADGADPEDVRAEDDDNTVGPNETFIKDPGGKESRTASYDSNWSLFL